MQIENAKSSLSGAAMLVLLSFLGAVTVAFFFVSVYMKDVAMVILPDSTMFVAPIAIGFILGLAISDKEIHYILFATILITAFTLGLTAMVMYSPNILGTAQMIIETDVSGPKNLILTGIITFPLTLVGSIVGKFYGETALYATSLRQERDALKLETTEWYSMLEKVEGDKLKDTTEAPDEWKQTGAGHKPVAPPEKPKVE